ncbi:BMC domain-containing protein [Paenibacillus sp. 481]|uniref:BMC domain-containing protein n=1 Tax=Paenibacillus sp. 481 TaxID=2835869 RepID=UPI001E434ABB|nr:BMC domain-containing protein [Paenibacillus sp. 481]UHA72523.1 BMC domain-containing protein [Paenibacillus sp. 481]
MRNFALGLVEVDGYLGAIAALDAALKAANVTCIGMEKVNAGIMTVKLSGDVGAVQAAVAAGAETAAQLKVLLRHHVIARLHEETAAMMLGLKDESASEQQPEIAKEVSDHTKADAMLEVDVATTAKADGADTPVSTEATEASASEVNVPGTSIQDTSIQGISNQDADTQDTTFKESGTQTGANQPMTSAFSEQMKVAEQVEAIANVASLKPTASSIVKRSKNKNKASS